MSSDASQRLAVSTGVSNGGRREIRRTNPAQIGIYKKLGIDPDHLPSSKFKARF